MLRLSFIAFLAAASLYGTAHAQDSLRSYLDGARYLALPEASREAYVMGLSDMSERMARAVGNEEELAFLDRVRRCTSPMTATQLRVFVDDYVKSDPAHRSYGMASNYRAAVFKLCPP